MLVKMNTTLATPDLVACVDEEVDLEKPLAEALIKAGDAVPVVKKSATKKE